MLASAGLIVVVAAIGFGLTTWMAVRLRLEERIAIGLAVGPVAVSVVALAVFTVIGMSWATLALALASTGAGAAVGLRRCAARLGDEARYAWRRLRLPVADRTSLRPLAALTLAGMAVSTRTLALGYQTTPEGLSAGSLAVWADGAAHAAYSGSFAYGDNRGFDLPIAAGHSFSYHFLADFFAALFTVVGASVPQGLNASAWMLAVAWPVLVWCVVERVVPNRIAAGLTVLLFTLSGGIGLWYFAADVSRDGWGIVRALPRTYARIPDAHLWVDNTISASLYAQRSTQLGLTAALAAAILVLAARPAQRRAGFAAAGTLIGVMGVGHAHTLLTALALGGLALLADRRRVWWWFLGPAAVIGLPLAAALLPDVNSTRWMVGWMARDSGQLWPWFWFRNVGLLLPLFAGISLLGGVPTRVRRLALPLWLWFAVPNLIAFHPSEWNNTKYFAFWQFAGCVVVASFLARAWGSELGRAGRAVAARAAAALTVAVMISAGSLDTVRAMQRATAIPWVTNDDLAAAAWMRDHTPADAVIVYGMSNTSAVFSLGGRRAVSARDGWTWDLGIADWHERWQASSAILAGGPDAPALVARYGVDYVVIGPAERTQLAASDVYWREHGTQAFCAGEHCIYATR